MATSGFFAATVPTFGLIPFAGLTASAGDMKLMACDVSGAHSMSFPENLKMPHSSSISLARRMAVLLTLLVPLGASALDDTDCVNAWKKSSAKESCKYDSIKLYDKTSCQVITECDMEIGYGKKRRTTTHWTQDSVSKLTNRDGYVEGGTSAKAPTTPIQTHTVIEMRQPNGEPYPDYGDGEGIR